MVRERLSDFTTQKDAIVSSIAYKLRNGLFNQNLHDIFNRGRKRELNILDLKQIIGAIETKLRKAENIYHTHFGTEYDKNIIIHNSLVGSKIIETEFNFGTKVLKNKIEIIDPNMYREEVNMNFQLFILTIASLYENLVRLIETLLKKRVVYGHENPHQSIHLKILIFYWDNLVELDYRQDDEFYVWLNSHRAFLNQYLSQINSLRNSFIHGYSTNLEINTSHNEYMVKNYDTSLTGFRPPTRGGIIAELILNNFVGEVLNNSKIIIEDILNLFKSKISHHRTKVPL